MSVARADGTSARPLDWGAPAGRPPGKPPSRRRQTEATVRKRTAVAAAGAARPDAAAARRAESRPRLSAGQVWLFALCWLGIVAGAMAVVARQSAIAEAGYRIAAAEQQLAALRHETMLLEAEVARLADPERIYQIATEELGMVPRERFEVTVVATAEAVERPGRYETVAAAALERVQEATEREGFWAGLGRTVIGWLTGQAQTAAAKAPDQ